MIQSIQALADELRPITAAIPRDFGSGHERRSASASKAAYTRWSNPDYRAKASQARLGRKFPKQSELMSRRWADPEFRSRMIAALRKAAAKKGGK